MGASEDELRDWLVTATAACALAGCLAGILRPLASLPSPSNEPAPSEARTSWVRLPPPAAAAGGGTSRASVPPPTGGPPAAPAALPALSEAPPPALTPLPALPERRPAATAARGDAEPVPVRTAGGEPPGSVAGPVRLTQAGLGGSQPWPEYPAAALRRGETGTVTVRLSVSPAGDVTEARVAASSGWRSLDEAATATIRRRWTFPPGEPRDYLVDIRFQIL